MDVLVVVLRLGVSPNGGDDKTHMALDVLLVNSVTTGHGSSPKASSTRCLPHQKISSDQDASEAAARLATSVLGLDTACQIRRVVSVSLMYDESAVSCTTVDCAVCGYGAALFCVPVIAGGRCL
ncbi:unnamed protein product [Soboliphyme baturini]|uniref:Uncharacterized protein n=1 Tax=Soboliphyme baturini TaxID=241478 RepID=A0A183INC5_9BILA|nr:unnamed protein product [Soboliphyme baturini]